MRRAGGTSGSATVNLFLNLTVAGGALWLLVNQQLINPEFFPAVIPADSAETVATVVSTLFGFGIVAIAAWDTVDAFLKAQSRALTRQGAREHGGGMPSLGIPPALG